MLDLDRKVSRDTIFLASGSGQLDGFFSKIVKKIKKVVGKLPLVKLYKKTSLHKKFKKFESKHRKNLKKLGAIVAIAVAVYFAGPAILKSVSSLGGKGLASSAGKKLLKAKVTSMIKKKLSAKQRKKLAKRTKGMTPEQVMQDPEIIKLSQQIATAQARQREKASNRVAAEILVKEGNIELTHQLDKISTPKHIETLKKVAIPAAAGLLAFII